MKILGPATSAYATDMGNAKILKAIVCCEQCGASEGQFLFNGGLLRCERCGSYECTTMRSAQEDK